jgi:hypothetical protein
MQKIYFSERGIAMRIETVLFNGEKWKQILKVAWIILESGI